MGRAPCSSAEYYRSYIEHHIAPDIGKIKLTHQKAIYLPDSYRNFLLFQDVAKAFPKAPEPFGHVSHLYITMKKAVLRSKCFTRWAPTRTQLCMSQIKIFRLIHEREA